MQAGLFAVQTTLKNLVASNKRVYSLDVLRGIAVLLVLLRHAPGQDATDGLLVLRGIGWTGVDLFFVLSGFLISGLLFEEFEKTGRLDLKRFWLRRGLKIWPSYFLTYGLAMLATVIATGNVSLLKTKLPNLVFLQNYTLPSTRWTHSWSIAIEEHFYIALPIILLLLRFLKLKSLLKIGVAICVSILALRIIMFATNDLTWTDFYYRSHFRADSLCFGVILGYLYNYRRAQFIRIARFWPLFLALTPFVALAYLFPLETSAVSYTIGFTILYLLYGGLVVVARSFPEAGKVGPLRLIAWTGVYSYTIYLAHSVVYELPGMNSVRFVVTTQFGGPGDRVLFFCFSVGLGVLISHLVERPFLRLRARLLPRFVPAQSSVRAVRKSWETLPAN